ncbi:zinc finger MYND domain-containing protein 10 [Protopterus annectens]|uniref:zinc finger MYND domain-containing protein 10 n=1 Tax=Protopterus annectens TaxID=7888 RepID=UPI001CF952A8|nr:zinc finger MYND domain-containing protein 10 [Protopterus annectens]
MEVSSAVLLPVEAEGFARSLEQMAFRDIGSPGWLKQHEYIEKLNIQGILNASANEDEFVKEYLSTYKKISVLIHDLISVEIWKLKIFPVLCQLQDFKPKSTFPIYMVIHHEATIVNLLETILYHKEACESADEIILDLIDYCQRKLMFLATQSDNCETQREDRMLMKDLSDAVSLQELKKQSELLEFDISLKSLTILRYITDHIDSLPLSALTRLLNIHNLPCLLVQLVEHSPWSKYKEGQLQKYSDGRWHTVTSEDRLKMTKLDGQVWIALYNLLLRTECQQKYDINSFTKNQLLKLRRFLTEVLIDQLPNLVELQKFLSHLSVVEPPPPKKELILQQIPEIWDQIHKENFGKWKAIAKYQVKQALNPSEEDLRQQALRWAETYNLDVMESLIPEKPKCGYCGAEGSKRCSRCQTEWYCGRQCQVQHWQKHKQACNLMADAMKKLKEELNIQP